MSEEKKRILIAEDEKPMAKALELKLNSSGFEAIAVFDGAQAIEELGKGGYDLVLLDLMMPKVDGFVVLEELKKTGNGVPVIVSTNLSQEEDEKRAKELGAVDYFVKSDTPIAQVIEHVKAVLNQ